MFALHNTHTNIYIYIHIRIHHASCRYFCSSVSDSIQTWIVNPLHSCLHARSVLGGEDWSLMPCQTHMRQQMPQWMNVIHPGHQYWEHFISCQTRHGWTSSRATPCPSARYPCIEMGAQGNGFAYLFEFLMWIFVCSLTQIFALRASLLQLIIM